MRRALANGAVMRRYGSRLPEAIGDVMRVAGEARVLAEESDRRDNLRVPAGYRARAKAVARALRGSE